MEKKMTDVLRGYVWQDSKLLDPIPAGLFPENCTPGGFAEILTGLDGCFCVIIERGNFILAAVDRIRSYPLFYAVQNNELLISDDAFELRSRLQDPAFDEASLPEFLSTGIVSGNSTLYRDIKQLEAGQYLVWDKIAATLQIGDHYVYRHVFGEENCDPAELDKVHERVIGRLIASAQGRTLVIPLSGGHDSRLIAVMLKRLGYPKVICFTYGSSHLPECQTSRKVAKFLNFPWLIVEQNRRMWFEAFHSEAMRRHFRYSTHLSVSPHIQDWLAVRTLKERALIPEDSLIVPGHSGDFPEGANLPQIFEDMEEISERQLLNTIFERQFNLWYCPNDKRRELFAGRVRDYLGIPENQSAESAASLFDFWDWRNREAKFIVNSVRVYEFFGYGWRLPLWDLEFLEFWRRVPLSGRMHQNLYQSYTRKYQYFLPESSNNLTLEQRIRKKYLSMQFGHLTDPAYGRFLDYRDRSAYLNARVASLCLPNLPYPDFINQELPVLNADINGLQALIYIRELLSGRLD